MPYTVTRQVQWPDGSNMVEISIGTLDYTNPDALVKKYPGEFETFDSPEEAVEAAIRICELWRQDGAPDAQIGYGATGGITMPFDACIYEEAREWAVKREDVLAQVPGLVALAQERWSAQPLYPTYDRPAPPPPPRPARTTAAQPPASGKRTQPTVEKPKMF